MTKQIPKKIVAMFLIFMLTIAHFSLLAGEVYALYEELEEQDETTNLKEVAFDSYFIQNNNKKHAIEANVQDPSSLSIEIGLNKGAIKNANIQLENTNYTIRQPENSIEGVSIDTQNNKIQLLNLTQSKQFSIPISFVRQDTVSVQSFDQDSKVRLTGTYIDENGKEREINKEITLHITWKGQIEAKIEQNVEKVMRIKENEIEKTMLQTKLQTWIENNTLPVEEMTANIVLSKLSGSYPEAVKVYANHTICTNGNDNGYDFNINNWTYNPQTGQLDIKVKNEISQDGKISWRAGADEYKIIAIYSNKQQEEFLPVSHQSNVRIKAYGNTQSAVGVEQKGEEVKNETTPILSNQLGATNEISKGYLYANSQYETSYQSKVETEIPYQEAIDQIEIIIPQDHFITENGSKLVVDFYYQFLQLTKKNFDTILGAEGKIQIFNQVGSKVGEINNQNQADENGNLVLQFENQDNQELKLVTSKPITEGRLSFTTTKQIRAQNAFTKEQIKTFKQIETKAIITGFKTEKVSQLEVIATTNLKETVTKAEVEISQTDLSTIVKNENVKFKIFLRTDSNEYDLFQNPIFEIHLPKEIVQIDIKSVEMLYDDELAIGETEVIQKEDGSKVIRIEIKGNQTQYAINSITKGANILLNTDLTLDYKATRKVEQIALTYYNEKANGYDNGEVAMKRIYYAAPEGVTSVDSISNYKEDEQVVSVMGKKATGKVDTNTEAKQVDIQQTILNNSQQVASQVTVLGRIAFSGNKDINTGESLNSNIDMKLITPISVENKEAQIYYSQNGEATHDLNSVENGWTEDVNQIQTARSYLVVFNDNTIAPSEAVTIQYQAQVPENLSYNKSGYGMYAVNYLEGDQQQEYTSAPLGVTTGVGPNLKIEIEASPNKEIAHEREIIKIRIKVTNMGQEDVNQVNIKSNIPQGTTYIKFGGGNAEEEMPPFYQEDSTKKEMNWGNETIKAGESITRDYEVIINSKAQDTNSKIQFKTTATVENFSDVFESNMIEKTLKKGEIQLTKISEYFDGRATIEPGIGIGYDIEVSNISDRDLTNLVIKDVLPEGLEYSELTENASYDAATRTVTWKIDKLSQEEKTKVHLQTVVAPIGEIGSGTIVNVATASADGTDQYTSDESITKEKAAHFQITKSSTVNNKYIKENQEFEYLIEVINDGQARANAEIIDELPDGILAQQMTMIVDNGQEQTEELYNSSTVSKLIVIEAGSTVKMSIKVKADMLYDGQTEKQVDNSATVSAGAISAKSNTVSHIVEIDPSLHPGEDIYGKNKIVGTAWNDENANGSMEENEARLSGIKIRAINTTTNRYVTNESENIIEITTGENGEYVFSGLEEGKYILVFEYDNSVYTTTTYKQQGIAEEINSDAMESTIYQNGVDKVVALTDNITVGTTSISGVNLGLIRKNRFDLSLEKSVSKITVSNKKGKKTYQYQNEKLAKVDIDPKQINNTTITVEYKIKVKNEGDQPGYARKILDYIPNELKFNSELNKDWYLSKNGELANTKLGNKIINPGETKEVNLVLSKKMTGQTTGTIINTAEIGESYNEKGLTDYNSTAGNKVDGENDQSSASIILGLKTGKSIVYTIFIITILGIIGFGTYIIKKKVL